MRIGIDVGGTHTDAVLIDQAMNVLAEIKTATTQDGTSGIVNALQTLLDNSGIDRAQINAVMIGTTHFTNALITGRNLAPTAVVRLALPSGRALPPLTGWPAPLLEAVQPMEASWMCGSCGQADAVVAVAPPEGMRRPLCADCAPASPASTPHCSPPPPDLPARGGPNRTARPLSTIGDPRMNTLTAENAREWVRLVDQAERLGWTAAHAHAVRRAQSGDLHHDPETGSYYATGRRGGRGRAIARARVRTLTSAGFLTLTGGTVAATADGTTALLAWDSIQPAAAEVEAEVLAPLYGGQEARRRHAAWEARVAEQEQRAAVRWAELEELMEEAEQADQEEQQRKAAKLASRGYRSTWDMINGPAPAYVDDADGSVTLNGVDVTSHVEDPAEAAAVETVKTPTAVPRPMLRRPAQERRLRRHPPSAAPARSSAPARESIVLASR